MFRFIKKLFKLTEELTIKQYRINYIVYGSLILELQYYCDARSEEEAESNFFCEYHEMYHDIISINEVEY